MKNRKETFEQLCERLAGEMVMSIGRGESAKSIMFMTAQKVLAWKKESDA